MLRQVANLPQRSTKYAVGVIGLFGFNIFFFLGLMHTSAVNAALIVSLNPALTIFLSHKVLGTPLLRKHIIGIFISFLGVAYLLLKGDLSNLFELAFSYGDILILIANSSSNFNFNFKLNFNF